MYKLSETEDLSFLIGAKLIQVCIGANEAILVFDGEIRITILDDFSVSLDGNTTTLHETPRNGATDLIDIMDQVIVASEATTAGNLQVEFESGARIIAFDNSTQYESFWIKGPNKEIIV